MDKKIHVRRSQEADEKSTRPSIIEKRRPMLIDSDAANFMAERDDESEDSPKCEETSDMQDFD